MKNEEILKVAIQIAARNKYELPFKCAPLDETWFDEDYNCLVNSMEDVKIETHINEIIFSHKFAEAFWGDIWSDEEMENEDMYNNIHREQLEPWQHHLQKMVLAENPIKYLEKFL